MVNSISEWVRAQENKESSRKIFHTHNTQHSTFCYSFILFWLHQYLEKEAFLCCKIMVHAKSCFYVKFVMSNVLNYILFHFYSTFAPLFSFFHLSSFVWWHKTLKRRHNMRKSSSQTLARLLKIYCYGGEVIIIYESDSALSFFSHSLFVKMSNN